MHQAAIALEEVDPETRFGVSEIQSVPGAKAKHQELEQERLVFETFASGDGNLSPGQTSSPGEDRALVPGPYPAVERMSRRTDTDRKL